MIERALGHAAFGEQLLQTDTDKPLAQHQRMTGIEQVLAGGFGFLRQFHGFILHKIDQSSS
ncbi:hypothetical protein D3C87_2034720 [compost metagenome]